MAYWWVSQNKTYRHQRGGGYLWAPARDKSGHTPQHWRTMLDVQPGDLIFSYVGQHIRSLAVAGSSARPDIRPPEFSDQSLWKQEGYRIDVSYEDLHPPIDIPQIAGDLARLLPNRHSPLTRRGTGVQGYLFSLPGPAGPEVEAFVASYADLLDEVGRRRVVRHGYLPEREVQTGIGAISGVLSALALQERQALVGPPHKLRARLMLPVLRDRSLTRWHHPSTRYSIG